MAALATAAAPRRSTPPAKIDKVEGLKTFYLAGHKILYGDGDEPMRYMTRDGETFEGETERQAALALRATSRTPSRDLAHFMAGSAAAARLQTGQHVRATTPEAFLVDLEHIGLIERLD